MINKCLPTAVIHATQRRQLDVIRYIIIYKYDFYKMLNNFQIIITGITWIAIGFRIDLRRRNFWVARSNLCFPTRPR
jgi:hypothetical protein